MGIEPTQPAWKAGILPLNNTRIEITGLVYHIPLGLSRSISIFLTGIYHEETADFDKIRRFRRADPVDQAPLVFAMAGTFPTK